MTTTRRSRAIIYLHWSPRGTVEDYIPYKLERLRPFADHVLVVSNGAMDPAGRAALAPHVDEILERENVGYDVWGYKDGLAHLADRIADFDEVVLMNYTFYGPIRPFGPVFERMEALDVDFWGMTEHAAIVPNPFTLEGELPEHIQSHWIAVRRPVLESEAWREYWATMPMIESYGDSINHHESRFTAHFESKGFRRAVAFPKDRYTRHAAFERADQLLEDGCPILKRRPFFHDPLYLDHEAIIGRRFLELAEEHGYPVELIARDSVRHAQPRRLYTNATMLEVLPGSGAGYDPAAPPRILATVHAFYEDMTDELLDRLETLPAGYDLIMTTTDEAKAEFIRGRIAARTDLTVGDAQVRVLPSNRGRDLSAFFIGCRDELRSGRYDLVVKIHSKKSVQNGRNGGEHFKRQQIENLLDSPGYAADLVGLFQRDPGLGLVVPPMVHIGFPTMGGAWFTNRGPTGDYLREIGVRVPLDESSPIAAYGAMWIARPEALALMLDREYAYEDYLPETEHRDGSLAHVQERAVAYAAAELGYTTLGVANTRYAALSHAFLEYKLDRALSAMPEYADKSIERIHVYSQLGWDLMHGGRAKWFKLSLARYAPRLARFLAKRMGRSDWDGGLHLP